MTPMISTYNFEQVTQQMSPSCQSCWRLKNFRIRQIAWAKSGPTAHPTDSRPPKLATMQSLAARGSSMLGHTRLAAPSRSLMAPPRRVEVIVMAVPKKKMSKSKTNLRYTVWVESARKHATIALMKGRMMKKRDAAAAPEASTGVAASAAPPAPPAPPADKQ